MFQLFPAVSIETAAAPPAGNVSAVVENRASYRSLCRTRRVSAQSYFTVPKLLLAQSEACVKSLLKECRMMVPLLRSSASRNSLASIGTLSVSTRGRRSRR